MVLSEEYLKKNEEAVYMWNAQHQNPCPICNEEPYMYWNYNYFQGPYFKMRCRCGWVVDEKTFEDAVKAWNNRTLLKLKNMYHGLTCKISTIKEKTNMASRPYFVANEATAETFMSDQFKWSGGFAKSQKQKNIIALHNAIKLKHPELNILEISSSSLEDVGVKASAFNLKLNINGILCTVESVFQASKVFVDNEGKKYGPFPELYSHDSREVRKYVHEIAQGKRLYEFNLNGNLYPLEPKTCFYDGLYIKALQENPEVGNGILKYNAFTDIEFNPVKQINCQAKSAALFVCLSKTLR